MTQKIDEDTLNSNIVYCIDEYVRLVEHREMLKQWWFEGKTLEQIAAEHHLSMTRTKEIIYGTGDKVLLRASKMGASDAPAFHGLIAAARLLLSRLPSGQTATPFKIQ